jgi:hypothetical protein
MPPWTLCASVAPLASLVVVREQRAAPFRNRARGEQPASPPRAGRLSDSGSDDDVVEDVELGPKNLMDAFDRLSPPASAGSKGARGLPPLLRRRGVQVALAVGALLLGYPLVLMQVRVVRCTRTGCHGFCSSSVCACGTGGVEGGGRCVLRVVLYQCVATVEGAEEGCCASPGPQPPARPSSSAVCVRRDTQRAKHRPTACVDSSPLSAARCAEGIARGTAGAGGSACTPSAATAPLPLRNPTQHLRHEGIVCPACMQGLFVVGSVEPPCAACACALGGLIVLPPAPTPPFFPHTHTDKHTLRRWTPRQ